MMRRVSLRHALARQWMLFTALLSAVFGAALLLSLFVLEDSFIDRRLKAVAMTITDPVAPSASLPEQFELIPWSRLPDDIRMRIQDRGEGSITEFRRTDGRYVHALVARGVSGSQYALIYDVSAELTVNRGLSRGWGYALALLLGLLSCAWLLARNFAVRAARNAERLIAQVLASPDPDSLDTLAAQEPVREFGDLLRLHADVWRQQRQAVEHQRETLAFLGHELRTPLQSACTSVALLEHDPGHVAAMARLQRAIQRLTRASNAILWLSSDVAETMAPAIRACDCLLQLVEELQPLAAARGQRIRLSIAEDLHWSVPLEVIDTLLANLLLNAIQHGSEGVIAIQATADALVICNPVAGTEVPGFGLGLAVAERLATRIGWRLAFTRAAQQARICLDWPGRRS